MGVLGMKFSNQAVKRILVVFALVTGVLSFFQNCAEPLPDDAKSSTASSSSSSSGGELSGGGGDDVPPISDPGPGVGTGTTSAQPGGGGTAASCPNTPWGTMVSGASNTAYLSQYPTGTCQSELRTCSNGVLSGSFTVTSCTAEIAKVAGAGVNLVLQSLFTADQWNSPVSKRVMVANQEIIGSNNELPAVRTGSAWGGTLTLQNGGSIQGDGGSASSGAGGTALKVEANGLRIENSGSILAGGGGGGNGGKGGNCTYNETVREPATGTRYDTNVTTGYFISENYNPANTTTPSVSVMWGGAKCRNSTNRLACDGYTYVRGAKNYDYTHEGDSGNKTRVVRYAVYRTSSVAKSQVGGAGSPGGVGIGYHVSSTGIVGAGVATNGCGAAGAGGMGGDWGNAGVPGANGANGNAGAGTAGAAGGAPGYAIDGAGKATLTGTGQIRGPTRQ